MAGECFVRWVGKVVIEIWIDPLFLSGGLDGSENLGNPP